MNRGSIILLFCATVSLLFLIPAHAAPPDINGDGIVNIQDLGILLSNWNTSNAAADINSSGSVDIQDLGILLSSWNTSPSPTPPPSISTSYSFGCPDTGYNRLITVTGDSELRNAFSNAQPGDQIRLSPGTYAGNITLSKSGTANARITLCGTPGDWPIIQGGGRVKISGSYITITGIVFAGPAQQDVNVWLDGGHHLEFIGNEVRDSDWHAGISVDYTHHSTIAYNYIHDNGIDTNIDHGIYFRETAGSGNRIVRNLIINNAARGISIHDNDGAAISDVLVAHNTIVGNGATGILLNCNAGTGNIIANNILALNGEDHNDHQIRGESGQNFITHNIVWHPNSRHSGIDESYATADNTLVGNLEQDPLFIDTGSDWHLRATSPAIDAGLTEYSIAPDLEGITPDSTPDIGAYEFN